jgi:hypothetical protein
MARGGARNGSGRKKGSRSRQTAEVEALFAEHNYDPLESMIAIAQHEKASLDLKGRMAIALAKYRYAERRPEAQPQRVPIDSTLTPDRQVGQVVDAWSAGTLTLEDGRSVLQGLAYAGEIRKTSVLEVLVAGIYRGQGREHELPPYMQLLGRVQETTNQEKTP